MARIKYSIRSLMTATGLIAVSFAVFGVVIGGIALAVVLLRHPLKLRERSLVTLSLVLVSVLLVLSANKAHWVGRMDVEIRFSIVDGRSGQPIPGAVIAFFEVDCPPGMKGTPLRTLVTDGDGAATLVEAEMLTGRDLWPWGRQESVRMPYWGYRVSGAGFESRDGDTLYDLIGTARDTDHPNPPLIRFGLSRKPTP